MEKLLTQKNIAYTRKKRKRKRKRKKEKKEKTLKNYWYLKLLALKN
jgi:hypothetical protein